MNKINSLILAFFYHVVHVAVICVLLSCESKEAALKRELGEVTTKAEKFQAGFNRLEREKKDLEERFSRIKEENSDFDVLLNLRNRHYEIKSDLEERSKELLDRQAGAGKPLNTAEKDELINVGKLIAAIPADFIKMIDKENEEFKKILKRRDR